MKWPLRITLSIVLAGGLLALLMVYGGVGPGDVLAAVGRVPPSVYLLALALHLFTYSMRALRFRVLLPREHRPGFRRSLVISSAHNMASYLLPAKTGEASLVVYLRLQAAVPASRGLAALLVARFLDGATLCIALALACSSLRTEPRFEGLHWLGSASVLLASSALLFLLLSIRGDLIVRAGERVLRWIRLHHWTRGERFLVKTNSLAQALRAESHRGLGAGILFSLALWASVFGFYALLSRAMGMPDWVGYPEATFGAALGTSCG